MNYSIIYDICTLWLQKEGSRNKLPKMGFFTKRALQTGVPNKREGGGGAGVLEGRICFITTKKKCKTNEKAINV